MNEDNNKRSAGCTAFVIRGVVRLSKNKKKRALRGVHASVSYPPPHLTGTCNRHTPPHPSIHPSMEEEEEQQQQKRIMRKKTKKKPHTHMRDKQKALCNLLFFCIKEEAWRRDRHNALRFRAQQGDCAVLDKRHTTNDGRHGVSWVLY